MASIIFIGKQVCANFFATISQNQFALAPPRYVANTTIQQIAIRTRAPIHSKWIIFFLPVVSPPRSGNKFTMNVARLIKRVKTPTVMYEPLKASVQEYPKNKKGHTKFPGALVYLNAQSNSPKRVMALTTITTSAWNPTYRCTTLLLAQLLVSPMPPKPTIITTPASIIFIPYRMKNALRLKIFFHRNSSIAMKFRPNRMQEIGRPIVTRVCEQSLLAILLIN